ncbi:MAG: hypothetical protein K1060chlam4_00447 [Candidatus Anoxychlamydiales bacterium]|nr:hypothetical protein [Candidatus Anoxychlamydiales bacterium]
MSEKGIYFLKECLEKLKLPELTFLSMFFSKGENPVLTQVIEEKEQELLEI